MKKLIYIFFFILFAVDVQAAPAAVDCNNICELLKQTREQKKNLHEMGDISQCVGKVPPPCCMYRGGPSGAPLKCPVPQLLGQRPPSQPIAPSGNGVSPIGEFLPLLTENGDRSLFKNLAKLVKSEAFADPVSFEIAQASSNKKSSNKQEAAGSIDDVIFPTGGLCQTMGAEYEIGVGGADLECGGTVELAPYSMSLVSNPTGLVIVDAGSKEAQFYNKSGSSFTLAGKVEIPTAYCVSNAPVQTSALQQLHTINSNTNKIAIAVANSNSYIILKRNGNNFSAPSSAKCLTQEELLSPLPADFGEVAIHFAPQKSPVCSVTSLYPESKRNKRCHGKIQYVDTDNMQLYYPTGAKAKLYSIVGRSEILAEVDNDATIFTPMGTQFKLGLIQEKTYSLPRTGSATLNGRNIYIGSPGRLKVSATGSVTLIDGGQTTDDSKRFLSNTKLQFPKDAPISIDSGGELGVGNGMLIPALNSGVMRLPYDAGYGYRIDEGPDGF